MADNAIGSLDAAVVRSLIGRRCRTSEIRTLVSINWAIEVLLILAGRPE